MGGSSSAPAAPPAPTPVDPGQSALDFTRAMADPVLQGQILQSEQTYRPQYADLNLADMNTYMSGSAGQKGFLDLTDEATQRANTLASNQISQQRAADIRDVEALGGQASAAFMNANPALAQQMNVARGLQGGVNPYQAYNNAVSGGQPNLGNLNFQNAQVSELGAAPTAASQGYAATNAQGVAPVSSQNIDAGYVMGGPLGAQIYGQAMGAGGLGSTGQALDARAQELAQSRGKLTPTELRQLEQSSRAGYAARGREMGAGSVAGEAFARYANERQNQQQDLSLASALNQGSQAELMANRGFQQSVQGNELQRAFQNVGNNLSAQSANQGANLQSQMANQGVSASQSAANQAYQNQAGQFGAASANQAALANQQMQAQYGMANQGAQNQFNLYNSQQGMSTQDANRAFAAQQFQQGLGNLGAMGQYNAAQQGQDRSYALALAQQQQGMASDPFMSILGRPSQSQQAGIASAQFASGLAGQNMGPMLFNPNAGINLAMQNNANQSNYQSSIFGAQAGFAGAQAQARGAMIGGLASGLGALGGGFASRPCWVAREVYGIDNPKWLRFREWMLHDSPAPFRYLYLRYGERFAAFISNKPKLKNLIRKWMDKRIENAPHKTPQHIIEAFHRQRGTF